MGPDKASGYRGGKRDLMKFWIGLIVVFGLIIWGSWALVSWAFEEDAKNATEYCASLGAEPSYIKSTHGVCLTPDGRVAGTF